MPVLTESLPPWAIGAGARDVRDTPRSGARAGNSTGTCRCGVLSQGDSTPRIDTRAEARITSAAASARRVARPAGPGLHPSYAGAAARAGRPGAGARRQPQAGVRRRARPRAAPRPPSRPPPTAALSVSGRRPPYRCLRRLRGAYAAFPIEQAKIEQSGDATLTARGSRDSTVPRIVAAESVPER